MRLFNIFTRVLRGQGSGEKKPAPKGGYRQELRCWRTKTKPRYESMLDVRLNNLSIVGFFHDALRGRNCTVAIKECSEDARRAINQFIIDQKLDVEILGDNAINEYVSSGRDKQDTLFYLHGHAAHIAEILTNHNFEIRNSKRIKRYYRSGKRGYDLTDSVLRRQLNDIGAL